MKFTVSCQCLNCSGFGRLCTRCAKPIRNGIRPYGMSPRHECVCDSSVRQEVDCSECDRGTVTPVEARVQRLMVQVADLKTKVGANIAAIIALFVFVILIYAMMLGEKLIVYRIGGQ